MYIIIQSISPPAWSEKLEGILKFLLNISNNFHVQY